ncbi:hypothetical protein PR048_022804 [Dryococelus australis]|uniref:Major facilitator superfamily (MFS) profile domain-containing protein n=1 Tax=Dryococelus australis TaxID=614101 RepID=A0ABQ9GSE7_9NEOP|nr:hypothetical protein PR048_022804 [Dryococelus australis]
MIVGSLFSYMAVEKCGRRILLLVSDLVITMCLIAVGIYFYLQCLGCNMEVFGWLPIASMCLYVMSILLGIGILAFTIGTEMVHPNYRSLVQTTNVMFLSITCFVTTFTYTPLVNVTGDHGCFWFYAACCAIGTVCILLTVPDTKNRCLEDILDQLNSDNYIRSVLYYKEGTNNLEKNAPSGKARLTSE